MTKPAKCHEPANPPRRTFLSSTACAGVAAACSADVGEAQAAAGAPSERDYAVLIVSIPELAGGCRLVRIRRAEDMVTLRAAMGASGWCVPLD